MIFNIIAFKGGVGKTTTTVNLAYIMAKFGKKVLVIDADFQSNTTMTCEIDPMNLPNTIYDVLLGQVEPELTIRKVDKYGFDLIPATESLGGLDADIIMGRLRAEDVPFMFEKCINKIKDQYDFILIDNGPGLNNLALNTINVADEIISPVDMGIYSFYGFRTFLNTVRDFRSTFVPQKGMCKINVLYTFTKNNKPTEIVTQAVKDNFANETDVRILETRVPDSSYMVTSLLRYGKIPAATKLKERLYINLYKELIGNDK